MDNPEAQKWIEELKQFLPGNNDEYSISSFISHLVSAQLCASFPLLATAASIFLPTALAQWQIHEGMPEGGIDLCKTFLFGCIQGYLTNGTAPWSFKMPQLIVLCRK